MQITSGTTMPTTFTKRATSNGTLMDAHKQWANRPADEAVYSVSELLAATAIQRTESRELTGIKWADLSVSADMRGNLVLTGGGLCGRLNNYSMGQLCALPASDETGGLAPAGFMSRLSPDTAAIVLNERMQTGIQRAKPAQALVRGSQLRSITTDAYSRVWDHEIAQRVENLCARGTWGKAEAFRQAGTDGLARHAFGEQRPLPLGWVGDRSTFVCLVDYEGALEHSGNQYARFLLLSNSEVGAGALKVTFGLMDFACCNFILWGCHEVYEASFRHTASIGERWQALSVGMQKQLSGDERSSILSGITAARAQLLGDNSNQVVAVTMAATGLGKDIVAEGYERASRTERYGNPNSVWGMVNGLTEASQHAANTADKRAAIDAKAARLMGLLR